MVRNLCQRKWNLCWRDLLGRINDFAKQVSAQKTSSHDARSSKGDRRSSLNVGAVGVPQVAALLTNHLLQ